MDTTAHAPGLVGWVGSDRKRAGVILAVLAALVGGGVTWLASKYGRDYLAVEILLGLLAVLFAVFGVLFAFRPADAGSPRDEAMALVLAAGGMAGLIVSLVGLVLTYQWWGSLMEWLRDGKREGAQYVLPAVTILVAGLAIMFASVQTARDDVRKSSLLRKLVYGYNAVLSGILLFLILAVANVLAYIRLPAVIDSSESSFAKLSEKSENVLRAIDKPVKVTMVMSTDSFAYGEMRPLLANAQGFCPQMAVETVQPIRGNDKYEALIEKYPQVNAQGILLVVGDGKTPQVGFLPSRDIIKGTQDKPTFEGEGLFVGELNNLAEDRKKPVVYFLSGNAGEFDAKDSAPNREDSVATLMRRLGDGNYECKALKFEPVDPKVPDDATVVVVPGPTLTYGKAAVDALRSYMDARKGKMIVLLGVTADREGKAMVETGLEPLLAAYKVDAGKDRIITLPTEGSGRYVLDRCLFVPDQNSANPITTQWKGRALAFDSTRQVRPAEGGGNPALRAEPLFETARTMYYILEPDAAASSRQVVETLFKAGNKAVNDRLQTTDVPIAVAVSENAAPPPVHGMPPPPERAGPKPRLVAFGSAKWVGNRSMDDRGPDPYFTLFTSMVDWLREKPANIGAESKKYKSYSISPDAGVARLLLLPPLFVLIGIVGLGAGVWVARRR